MLREYQVLCTIIFPVERSHSGLVRTLGKRVCPQGYRGFESLPLRHDVLGLMDPHT